MKTNQQCVASLRLVLVALATLLVVAAAAGTSPLPAALSRASAAPEPAPDKVSTAALRLFLVVDDSWSTAELVGSSRRTDRERQAGERWATALKVPSTTTVEVLTASDHVDIMGTFVLRSETDRAALIDAIHRIQPIRATWTIFDGVDRGLADVVRRDTGAGEAFAVLFLTDMVSDHPHDDLRAEDLGDRVVDIDGGVYAVVLGNVPALAALTHRGHPAPRGAPSPRIWTGHSSALRTLHDGLIQLEGQPALAGAVAPRLFGGSKPLRTEIRVDNHVGVAQLVRFESVAPPGVAVNFSPNPLVVSAGGSATTAVELSTSSAAAGDVVAIARLPDGRSQQHTMHVQLVASGWIAEHGWALALGTVAIALALAALGRRMGRTERVGHHADLDKQAALGIGDTAALATFAPDASGALRRGWLGYMVIADGHPLFVGGRCVEAGKRGRYRLGEDIRVGNRTFAIYRIDATMPPASATEFVLDAQRAGWATGGLR